VAFPNYRARVSGEYEGHSEYATSGGRQLVAISKIQKCRKQEIRISFGAMGLRDFQQEEELGLITVVIGKNLRVIYSSDQIWTLGVFGLT